MCVNIQVSSERRKKKMFSPVTSNDIDYYRKEIISGFFDN